MRIGSLFSGIGGLEKGLEDAGLGRVVFQCEIDPFCRQVLAKHWPEAVRYEDVRCIDASTVPAVDVLCGGFPCQDVSLAGKRAGLAGERSGLWSEFARIIGELQPRIVIIENVLGLRTSGLSRVLADLAGLGFDAEWSDLSAWDVGAPHLRRRLFIAATHPERVHLRVEPWWLERACREAEAKHRRDPPVGVVTDADPVRRLEQARSFAELRGWPEHRGWQLGAAAPVDDGLPRGLVSRARKSTGNAVVPQCAEVIGRALMKAIG